MVMVIILIRKSIWQILLNFDLVVLIEGGIVSFEFPFAHRCLVVRITFDTVIDWWVKILLIIPITVKTVANIFSILLRRLFLLGRLGIYIGFIQQFPNYIEFLLFLSLLVNWFSLRSLRYDLNCIFINSDVLLPVL